MKPTIVQYLARRGLTTSLSLGLLAAVAGCSCCDKGVTTLPPPLGTSINQAVDIQAGNAVADDFVVYTQEWFGDTAVLGPAGKRHLERMIKKLPQVACPIVIEPTGLIDLDRSRQDAIVSVLAMREVPDAAQRVTIDDALAEPLNADEAERIYQDRKHPQQGIDGSGARSSGIGADPWSRHIGSGSWWGARGSGSYGGIGRRGFFP